MPHTLASHTYFALRDEILKGQMPPGTPLHETPLATRLNVSRGTVRDALRRLREEGLAEVQPNGRQRVRTLTLREVIEVFEVRNALEVQAAVRLMQRPDYAECIEILRGAVPAYAVREGAGEADAAGDKPAADPLPLTFQVECNFGFFERLVALSGNATLAHLWRDMRALITMLIYSRTDLHGTHVNTPDFCRIITCLESRDHLGVHDALYSHHMEVARWWNEHNNCPES